MSDAEVKMPGSKAFQAPVCGRHRHSAGLSSSIAAFRNRRGGFTLLEVLMSIAIFAILATVIASGLAAFRESSALNQAVDETIGLLHEARVKTLASESTFVYGVHFDTSSVTLFRGGVYNAADPANVAIVLPSILEISGINLTTTTASVVFERLTGDSPATGEVVFTTKRSSKSATIEVLASGLFRKQ